MYGAVIPTVEFASTARKRKIRRSRRQHLGQLVTRGSVSQWNGQGELQSNGEGTRMSCCTPRILSFDVAINAWSRGMLRRPVLSMIHMGCVCEATPQALAVSYCHSGVMSPLRAEVCCPGDMCSKLRLGHRHSVVYTLLIRTSVHMQVDGKFVPDSPSWLSNNAPSDSE